MGIEFTVPSYELFAYLPSLSDVTRARDDVGDAETTARAQIFVCVRRTDTLI
jgi:hypothetical protein